MSEKKLWLVRYRVEYEGTADVEADTQEEAEALVEAGDFEDHPGQSRVNWERVGHAVED